jgi:hypothetical protein
VCCRHAVDPAEQTLEGKQADRVHAVGMQKVHDATIALCPGRDQMGACAATWVAFSWLPLCADRALQVLKLQALCKHKLASDSLTCHRAVQHRCWLTRSCCRSSP